MVSGMRVLASHPAWQAVGVLGRSQPVPGSAGGARMGVGGCQLWGKEQHSLRAPEEGPPSSPPREAGPQRAVASC